MDLNKELSFLEKLIFKKLTNEGKIPAHPLAASIIRMSIVETMMWIGYLSARERGEI